MHKSHKKLKVLIVIKNIPYALKASETQLSKFLQGPKQYVIPIYQRTYRWTEKQCERLWNDIIRLSKDDSIPGHFLGSVVYIQKDLYQASQLSPLLVIDGQQRLTTMTLLFAALGRAINKQEKELTINSQRVKNYYLFNNDEEGEKRNKLVLTKSDKETLFALLQDLPLPENYSKNIKNNFDYFQEQIQKSQIDLELLYESICKIIIVDISLDGTNDNPQLIFESLNSTGLNLSQADLIRNFVLMGLDISLQEKIYNTFWYPMESSFGHAEGSDLFDRFMRDYLTIKFIEIPKEREVYFKFKEFFSQSGYEENIVEKIVQDIHYYSKLFVMLNSSKTDDKDIDQRITNINSLKVEVAYPFLLQVLADWQKNIISREELINILDMVESYVFRRQICEIPPNSLNKTFATLYSMVHKQDYVNSLKAAFIMKSKYQRFPNNLEFDSKFKIKDVYNLRTKNFLFGKLENHDSREITDVEECTLEHIMPQNEKLRQEWIKELGDNWKEIHDTYLHTVGNITLTGYNTPMGDRSFTEKLEFFKKSPIRLNKYLAELEHWDKDEIIKRSEILADKAVKIWTYPELADEILAKYSGIEDEDDDEDDDEDRKWESLRSRATQDNLQLQDRLINMITEKYQCFEKPFGKYLAFSTSRPEKRANRFMLLSCGKNTSRIMFRIDSDTFMDNNEKISKVNGWFFPRGTERRIGLSEADLPLILNQIDHAYNATKKLETKLGV